MCNHNRPSLFFGLTGNCRRLAKIFRAAPLTSLSFARRVSAEVSQGSPDPVLSFVDRHIESLEHLEILLLLAAQDRSWSALEIFQKIQSSVASVEQRLQTLVAAGLLTKDERGQFRFAPKDEDTRKVVQDLAEAYRTRRVRIIEAIYTRKTDAVQSFADAFKFRKD